MSSINQQNLRIEHIVGKVKKVLKTQNAISNSGMILKIILQGHNTGEKVSVTEEFMVNSKEKTITNLERELGRSVKFGTTHIYVGDKLI